MNYSDGNTDEFFVLYKLGNKVHPCAISKDKLELIGIILNDTIVVKDMSIDLKTYRVEPNKAKVNGI